MLEESGGEWRAEDDYAIQAGHHHTLQSPKASTAGLTKVFKSRDSGGFLGHGSEDADSLVGYGAKPQRKF